MTSVTTSVRRGVRSGIRAIAYSRTSRNIARRLVEDPGAQRVRTLIEDRGHGAKLHRLASQQLPEGTYFAKLTIEKWQKYRNRSFCLYEGDRIVYGNRIEPPARGFDLEYRNIIVTSDDPADFHLDIDAKYNLKIGRGAFTTAQQARYDEQYGVKQHGDLFYSVRGNLKDPKRVLVTFPGFGPSTSRVSYAVSFLKGITEEDLGETLMVCFQDRYMVAGTYLLTDNAGNSLYPKIHHEISQILRSYEIPETELMFFGASKGGSIATYYADGFPESRLLAVVPQMNLPYYLDKPFFRENLYRLPAVRQFPQPVTLMRKYFTEGRRIDYFYTDRDEQSNFSLIEFVRDIPGLTKYRIDGEHSDVARMALPTVLTVIKEFLRGQVMENLNPTIESDQLTSFPEEFSTGFQVRLSNHARMPEAPKSNVLLAGDLGRTRFRQLLSSHTYPFIKYTAPTERLRTELHDASQITALHVTTTEGTFEQGRLPPPTPNIAPLEPLSDPSLCAELDVTPDDTPRQYSLLPGAADPVSRFEYAVVPGEVSGDSVVVVIARSSNESIPEGVELGTTTPRMLITAAAESRPRGAALLVHRFAVTAGVEKVHVVFTDPEATDGDVAAVRHLYGPDVICDDRRPLEVGLESFAYRVS